MEAKSTGQTVSNSPSTSNSCPPFHYNGSNSKGASGKYYTGNNHEPPAHVGSVVR